MWRIYIILSVIIIQTQIFAGTIIEDQVPIIFSTALPSPGAETDVRFIAVYLPEEAINNPDMRFPVVYYFPGLGGDHLTFADGNALIMDTLISENKISPFIVVHIDPSLTVGVVDPDGKMRYLGTWYINSALNGGFEDFIVEDLIPYVDSHYPTKNTKEYRGVMGQSMGGFGALIIGTKHPELFCGMCSASGTPFWTIITNTVPYAVDPNLTQTPGNFLFAVNSLIIPEIPTSGENVGKIMPDNGPFTFSFFSYSGALSPNINYAPFFVNLPFVVDDDNNPIFTNGSFLIADPNNGDRFTITQSLTPNQTVIDQWKIDNPYVLADSYVSTLQKQAILIDGGDLELINAVGARQLSDKYISLNINHEYILYRGEHETCLIEEICSRNQTEFMFLSAKFAEGGIYIDDIKTKIVGNGTFRFYDSSTINITNQTVMSIETDPENNVINTDIHIEMYDNSTIILGSNTENINQGILQIGNTFTKVTLQNNPTLQNDSVSFTLSLHGGNCIINNGGFLGLGVGVNGFFETNLNHWSLSTLTNIKTISLEFLKGNLMHTKESSPQKGNSLLAFGNAQQYLFYLDPANSTILGGGSTVTLINNMFTAPVTPSSLGLQIPGGERNIIDTNQDAIDYFFQKPINSVVFYENKYHYGILASSGQLDNKGQENPYTKTTDNTQDLFDLLALSNNDTYQKVFEHEGILRINDNNGIELVVTNGNGLIQIFNEIEILAASNNLDLRTLALEVGYLDVNCSTINDTLVLLRADDPRA